MNIFKDKTPMPAENEKNCPVHTTLSLDEERALRMSNYPRYDAMDVHHVERPKRGHHY